jgi:hypothetical protein
MIALLVLLVLLIVPAVWLFFFAQPRTTRTVAIRSFNIATLVFAICSAAAISTYSWLTIGQSVDAGWWPALAVFYSGFLIAFILIVGAVIRAAIFNGFSLRTLLIGMTVVAVVLGALIWAVK